MATTRSTLVRGTAALALSAALCGAASAQAVADTPAAVPAPGATAAQAGDVQQINDALAPSTPAGRPAVGEQNTAPQSQDEIIVTGSSIRGAPPVGSNLIAVGRAEIEETSAQSVQQILKTVPAVTGLGSVGQGAFGSADGSGTNAPTIHGLGASASNSTLVLIDGHRLPLGGINHTLGDPNIVPTIAIERVEVLADGASATYGSDAVAGVINFITRRRYDGVEGNVQAGFGDGYRTWNASLLAGTTWDTGSVMVAYTHSYRSNLEFGERSFTRRDHRSQGGSNLASFACSPATVQPAGQALIFLAPYTGAGIVNAQANATCDYNGPADLIPEEKRDGVFAKITQEVGDKLTLNLNGDYSNRRNKSQLVRGTVQATVFGPGSGRGTQINPYFTQVAGSTATSQTIRFDANDLLGPAGARNYAGSETFYMNAEAQYRLDDNWRITASGLIGFDNSRQQIVGQLCVSCAYLALNGTTNAAGSLTTPSIPGTSTIVTQALTGANSLDVWNALSGNRTSAAVRTALTDSTDTQLARQSIKDAVLKMDGSLFALPAGDVKVAFGGELIRYTLKQDITRPLNTGPATTGSSTLNLTYRPRSVQSAFLEALIPVIGPDMEIPGVQSFDINLSGRYDHYNDFGSTKNPKIAANWTVVDGLKLRGNYAESFVAPALTSRGSNALGITGESGYSGNTTIVNVPTALFPGIAGNLPGCAAGAVTCQIGGNLAGIQINGGNAQLRPQDGETFSFGADLNPRFLPGFRAGVTYWSNKIRGGVTSPQAALAVNIPSLANLMQIFPAGATQAQINALTGGLPQTGAISAPIYFIYNFSQKNVLNLDVTGIDFDFSYQRPTDFGTFSISGNVTRKLKFDQSFGDSPKFSVLGTTGFNGTFPSVKTEGRANIGWAYEGFTADFFWNYTGRYRNYSGNTVLPIVRGSTGLPTGSGGDKVKSQSIFDLNLSYTLPQDRFKKIQIFADVQNLFNKNPSFYNSNNGYDTFTGNPLLRVVTIGLRTAL